MAERIKVARELGDLKENAEYHIAKEDQAHLETRIKRLRQRLRRRRGGRGRRGAPIRSPSAGPPRCSDEASGKVHTWTLVGPTEADPGAGRISAESPVGQALRDAAVGAEIVVETPRGERRYTVTKLLD